jgi:CPA2 family monovalent cation:H+ antiporter-2
VSHFPILMTLAGGLAAALALGWLTQRLGLSTLVGYMLAGILVGPHTPGFVADAELAAQMAELGVILLMFGVGLHFHPQELLRVWRLAVPGAVAQSALAVVVGWACARALGWSNVAGVVFGMSLAVASTVVLMRMLVDEDRLATRDGHVAVGWLIVEDLFTVVALVVLPALAITAGDGATPAATGAAAAAAGDAAAGAAASGNVSTAYQAGALGMGILVAIAKAGLFAAIVWGVGTRVVGNVMERIALTRSAELFRLAVFVVALGVAVVASEAFDVSVALGAFFAGLVVGQSRFGPQAMSDMTPFRDVFSALFFVSVGMLVNPAAILSSPLAVLGALGVVLIVKPLVAIAVVRVLKGARSTSHVVAVGLAQIGEFSFILCTQGLALGLVPQQALDAIVIAAIVSIALNPLLFRLLRAVERREGDAVLEEAASVEGPVPGSALPSRPVVLAGAGELLKRLARRLAESGVPVRVVTPEPFEVEAIGADRADVVTGDPGDAEVLRGAGIADARILVVSANSLADKMAISLAARKSNPRVRIATTAFEGAERMWLREFGAEMVCDVQEELTQAIVRSVRDSL